MKKYSVFVLAFLTTTVHTSTLPSNATVHITATSRAILYVLYITQRIEPSLNLMYQHINSPTFEKKCAQEVATFFSNTNLIKTEQMQDVLTAIKKTGTLQPLFHIWGHIRQFKYGINTQEQGLILDFAKIYLITYQSIMVKSKRVDSNEVQKITPSELDMINQIDEVFEKLEHYTFNYFLHDATPLMPSLQIKTELHQELSASFAFRFYLNKRLSKTFKKLTCLQEQRVAIFYKGLSSLGFDEGDINFNDWVVHSYFEALLSTKNLTALMPLIAQFESFDFIKNALFAKEFLILICLIYKDLYFDNPTFARNHVTSIEELNDLSIEQLLTIIDTVTEKTSATTSHTFLEVPLTWLELFWQSLGAAAVAGGITYFLCKKQPLQEESISSLIQKEYAIEPDTFTYFVFSRYYFIKRLDEVIKLLVYLSKQDTQHAKTPLPLKPLSLAWQDFTSYKELANVDLITDFTKEIEILSHHFLHHHIEHETHYSHLLNHFFHTKETALDTTQTDQVLAASDLSNELASSIEINKVITRFYHVRRLEAVMSNLKKLDALGLLQNPFESSFYTDTPPLHFEEKALLNMLVHFETQKNFKPLFSLWNDIQRYKYINDEKLLKEFAQFVTQLLHNTIAHHTVLYPKGPLINQLHNMPLEDILNILDILVEELPEFLEKTELNSHSTLTWEQWFKKYWLVAPISTAIFGIKLYMMYKGVLERPHHHADIPTPVA